MLGQRPGPASDLWSLGVVLYAATEGVSPFRRSNTPATLQSVLNSAPVAPASAKGPLAGVINGLLNKDAARRPSADRVRALLEEAARPPAPESTPPRRLRRPAARRGRRLRRRGHLDPDRRPPGRRTLTADGGTDHLKGEIDEVRACTGVLSQTQLTFLRMGGTDS